MAQEQNALGRALHLRPGEGRLLAVLGSYLLLVTAATTMLAATKNGLFLSVYPGRYIPQVVIAAALLTAVVAVVFAGVIAGTARRNLALRLTAVLALVVLASRWAVGFNPRMALGVYLLMSVVEILLLTHAWDFASDMVTGRQAKRLSPLFGLGASLGALLGGAVVPLGAVTIGTDNLLLVAVTLFVAALPLLYLVAEPEMPVDETANVGRGAVRSFFVGAGRGFKSVGSHPLLRLMAVAMFALWVAGTLIELQLKLGLQASFDRDRITAVLGLLSAVSAVGMLAMQLIASRWLFPKLGASIVGALHGGLEGLGAWVLFVLGGFWPLAALQALDDILQASLQKPVEQVSLLPFPGAVKSSAVNTLNGVLQPLAQATAGVLAIAFLSKGRVMPALTALFASIMFLAMLRHRKRYMAALADALTRHTVDFGSAAGVPLVVDRSALTVIDRGLEDSDPTVVVFSLSLLEQLPAEESVPRAVRLLHHDTAEVRAEAAHVLGRLDLADVERPVDAVKDRLRAETSSFAQASLLDVLGEWGQAEESFLSSFLDCGDAPVCAAALVALGRSGWSGTDDRLRTLLAPGASDHQRIVGARAVGRLGRIELLPELAGAVDVDAVRPAALEAMSLLGEAAVPALRDLLKRRELPLPMRRSFVTALAAVPHQAARDALLELVDEPALGPAALTSLQRMRRDDRIDPVDPTRLRATLQTEIRRGLRYALVSEALRETDDDLPGRDFTSEELRGLTARSVYRVMRVLNLSHDPSRIDSVHAALTGDDPAGRSNALELLEGTLSPEEGRVVMPFAEAASEGFPVERVSTLVPTADEIRSAPLESLLNDDDWWTRSLALHGLRRDHEIRFPGRDPDQDIEDREMIPLIERVMILKGSQLFRYFPGGDLAGIASLAEVVHMETDDVVFEQGEAGDAFYMVVRGGIRIMRGSVELALLGPREGFGEMAILDQETRSATATAAEPTTLLRIDRDSFDRLIEQNPSVARGIYRMLTQRLRNTLAQVAAG